jgi:hypothetical protein
MNVCIRKYQCPSCNRFEIKTWQVLFSMVPFFYKIKCKSCACYCSLKLHFRDNILGFLLLVTVVPLVLVVIKNNIYYYSVLFFGYVGVFFSFLCMLNCLLLVLPQKSDRGGRLKPTISLFKNTHHAQLPPPYSPYQQHQWH